MRPTVFLAVLILATGTQAEVIDANSNGFSISHTVTISADRTATYDAAIGVGNWWNGDHTMSGDAGNLSITTSLPGCFCESLGGEAGFVHMLVTFVNPGVILRLTGGLGPLGLMGVDGNMTWEFEDREDGTVVSFKYAVGGYMPGGLDTIAPAVDGVIGEQLSRLKAFVETGSADG